MKSGVDISKESLEHFLHSHFEQFSSASTDLCRREANEYSQQRRIRNNLNKNKLKSSLSYRISPSNKNFLASISEGQILGSLTWWDPGRSLLQNP